MANGAYTIRILVEDGDPEGVRVIEQMNWTGVGVAFPRELWSKVKNRSEFERPGVYVLVGYDENDGDMTRIYVGEGDGIRPRLEQHIQKKAFWNWAIAFTSNAGALNKAHVQWLEHALVQRAHEAKQCSLDNGNAPQAPALTAHELADVRGFLEQMLRILPLVNLHAFELGRPVSVPGPAPRPSAPKERNVIDTIIVPAQKEGFERVFLGQDCWFSVRIGGAMLPLIRYCAAYQAAPDSAVTYVAPVKHIEPIGDAGKYRIVFSEKAQKIAPIPFADAPMGSMQGPRYTTLAKLKAAKKVTDLF